MNLENEKTYITVDGSEADRVSRKLLVWLNSWQEKPVSQIDYEYLVDDAEGMALSTIQGAYKSRQYILGGYEAQYQFKIIYRIQANSTGQRLSADETLNRLADWIMSEEMPSLGDGISKVRFETNARSSLFARYEDGSEDHQILMTLIYEVNT